MDIILKILEIILIVISSVLTHEAFHYLIAKYDNANPKFETEIWRSGINYDIDKLKHVKLFFIFGSFGQFIFGILLYSLFLVIHNNVFLRASIYNILISVFGIVIIAPDTDIYKMFQLQNKIKFTEENLWMSGLWIIIGRFLTFLLSIILIWKILI